MNSRFLKRALAALALAAAALLAAPAMAQAVGERYPADDSYQAPPASVAPGGTVTLGFPDRSFAGNQPVSFTLNGENAESGATIASFRTAIDTQSRVLNATPQGALTAKVTLPTNAIGTYNLTAAASGTGWTRTWKITVANPGGSATASDLAVGGSDSNQALWIWVGGGALALVGGGLLVASSIRKKRKQAE